MSEILKLIREEYLIKINKLGKIVPRELLLAEIPNKIKVIIGMRRTGKTYFLLAKIQSLLAKGIPYQNILYLNLEDDRLQQMNAKQLAKMIDAYYELFPTNHHERCYLFFDEIQTVDGWPKLIRRLHDTKDVEIFLTGSSAKLLSKEIATELRGRSIAYEMWPFSFKEYLLSKDILPTIPQSKISLDHLKSELFNYLTCGGFPEINVLNLPERNRILQDYVDVVVYRDIIERHHITNLALVKYMISYLIKNTATNISMNKLYNDLRSQGYSIGRSTVYDYLEYVNDAYLAFMAPLYSESIRKMQANPRKIYTIDMGLNIAFTLSKNANMGRLFENMIYIDLRRKGEEIYFYLTQEKYEVDFLTRSIGGSIHLYQVALDIENPKTLAREESALQMAEKELGIKGQIITPETYLKEFYIQQGSC